MHHPMSHWKMNNAAQTWFRVHGSLNTSQIVTVVTNLINWYATLDYPRSSLIVSIEGENTFTDLLLQAGILI